ncbi:uncharacterized protein LOC126854791 [Cataglyphis hispanica]|uniref:uncharacterized protein LOC126854791 n=1 Tax=Cataglyphis hispanica TaxID=1086592 RepID=UPI00217F30EB|nr:uncharacterized protein LOC126854791 [Cataglyphis hispanica]
MCKDMEAAVQMQFNLYERIARSYKNFKMSRLANITIGLVEARLQYIENNWTKFEAQHDKLIATYGKDLSENNYCKEDIQSLTEELYLSYKGMLLDAFRNLKSKDFVCDRQVAMPDVKAPITGANPSQLPHTNLPRIQTPQFSGLHKDWLLFRDLFHALIGKDVSITPVKKLHYLKECLKGEAELLIRNLPMTDKNFDCAWKILTDYYEKRLLVHSDISKFIQKLKDESVADLDQNIRADVTRKLLVQDLKRQWSEEVLETRPAKTARFNKNVHEMDITSSEQEEVTSENSNSSSEQSKEVKKKSSTNNRRKIYQGRASKEQIEALVTYLEQYPNLTSDRLSTLNDHEKLQNDWEKLARYLNELVPNKKKKDVKSWKNTWRDQKCKVLKKMQKIARAIKENNLIKINLTELDKRILKIIGCHKYVKDLMHVSHSFPEEQNNATEKLRAENSQKSSEIIKDDKYAETLKMLTKIKKLLKKL